MPTGTWKQPDRATQSGTEYKNNIESCIKVAERLARAFAPHEQSTPNMTVMIDPGYLWVNGDLTEISAQSTGTITPPSNNPRIDRVVLDPTNGTVAVVQGTPGANPTPPAIPSGKLPICQIYLEPNQTAILNQHITDERVIGVTASGSGGGFGIGEIRTYSSPGSYQFAAPINSYYLITAVGGGGGGGGGGNTGGGGGGAGEAITSIRYLSAGTVFNMTVGAGGAGGSGSANGGNGSNTIVTSDIVAAGGWGGASSENGGAGGPGGWYAASATDWNMIAKMEGGEGGNGTTIRGGKGRSTGFGLGGNGATSSQNATAGTFGSGGGGGYGSRAGAAGGDGLIIIRW